MAQDEADGLNPLKRYLEGVAEDGQEDLMGDNVEGLLQVEEGDLHDVAEAAC